MHVFAYATGTIEGYVAGGSDATERFDEALSMLLTEYFSCYDGGRSSMLYKLRDRNLKLTDIILDLVRVCACFFVVVFF